jgi:hypothetical protein
MKYLLIYEENEEFGGMGLRIDGSTLNSSEYNMATDGLLIAHDILEHSKIKDIGPIGDELKALGAIMYVRGQFGELRKGPQMHSIETNLASDITRMARDWFYSPHFDCPIPNAKTCDYLESFEEAINISREELPGEMEGDETFKRADIEPYFKATLSFMIKGYQNAVKRFSHINDSYHINRLFWNIAESVDVLLKHAEYEGQQFILHINMTKNRVMWEEYYPEEDY